MRIGKTVYEDDEIVLEEKPSDEEIKKIVLEIIRVRGIASLRDIREELSVFLSDDKLRELLRDLKEEGKIKTVRMKGKMYYTVAENCFH